MHGRGVHANEEFRVIKHSRHLRPIQSAGRHEQVFAGLALNLAAKLYLFRIGSAAENKTMSVANEQPGQFAPPFHRPPLSQPSGARVHDHDVS